MLTSSIFIPMFVTNTLLKIAHSGNTAVTIAPFNLSVGVKRENKLIVTTNTFFKAYNEICEYDMCRKSGRGRIVNTTRNKRTFNAVPY